MAGRATFSNKGRLRAKIERLSASGKRAAREAIEGGAEEIAAAQRRAAPTESGALRDSIKVQRKAGEGGADIGVRIVAGDAKAWYARIVEFGTRPHIAGGKFKGAKHPGARARPYFYPTYRAYKKRFKSRVVREINRAIKEAVK